MLRLLSNNDDVLKEHLNLVAKTLVVIDQTEKSDDIVESVMYNLLRSRLHLLKTVYKQ